MSESAKRHEENSNLIKEIRASMDAAIRNQGASIKTLEIQIGKMSKNHTLMYETRQMMIPFRSRLNGYYCEEKKGSYGPQFLKAHSKASHINNPIPRKEKDPGSFTLPCFINNACFDNDLVYFGASLDLEARLMGETLVINRSLDPLNGDYIELNDLNEPFELRRNHGDDLMPTIEEEVGIKARRFKGMITIYNGNDEVTYQMVRSHLRFKHHTNEQCNKILPLLKVCEEDKKNGISNPYQKLKGFYKGVLNLGPNYIRDARTEEWLTRGHISVHEME
ncbi:hypothetical protein Tco_0602486 [Tanacetum coccineum]